MFIFRWGKQETTPYGVQVKFSGGGGIIPKGGLTPGNFVHLAGDLNASGGGSNPPAPFPQGPYGGGDGQGTMVNGASDFSGGGFFVGYWLTTGSPDNRESSSLSNGIFVGGWYTSAIKLSMTYGTSGVHVCPNPSAVQSPEVASESPSLSPTGSPVVADSEAPSKIPTGSPALLVDPQGVDSTESPTTPVITTTTSPVASLVETPENSICQLTTVTVTESIKVTTVAIKLNYTGCVTVTVEHKIDDSPWTMMCTAHNVYGQAPDDTLANSDHCTPLVLSAGQTVDFRTKTQPSNDCGPGSGGNIVPFSSFYLQVAYSTTENVCPI